jgi:hypothetical protein
LTFTATRTTARRSSDSGGEIFSARSTELSMAKIWIARSASASSTSC